MSDIPNEIAGKKLLRDLEREIKARKILKSRAAPWWYVLMFPIIAGFISHYLGNLSIPEPAKFIISLSCTTSVALLFAFGLVSRRLEAAIELIKLNDEKSAKGPRSNKFV